MATERYIPPRTSQQGGTQSKIRTTGTTRTTVRAIDCNLQAQRHRCILWSLLLELLSQPHWQGQEYKSFLQGSSKKEEPPPHLPTHAQPSTPPQKSRKHWHTLILFDRGHPYWETKRGVFCNENLHLLHGTSCKHKPVSSYPIFVQQPDSGQRQTTRSIHAFAGCYLICAIRYLEPYSRQLAANCWTVITMLLDTRHEGEGGGAPPPPPIVDLEAEAAAEKRTVNEILAEMRELGDFVG
ncbi:hypothetical protein ACO22_07496 [Paracoccidioides brasiliensis]|uniref:Uncharacterized protein n=1 Tax=Paracoccidioides brasiliensis TaxID=121759 RepID=A0A1D2J4G4_PARBR|nr:hypothetical protein ACO22_07496 [Paracoccidioides brasiliensis]